MKLKEKRARKKRKEHKLNEAVPQDRNSLDKRNK
jgi:hypothetical protein